MNDNTAKLLEQLASKLGTTSEYLWGILLKQAPIDSTISIIQVGFVVVFGWLLTKAHIRLIKPIPGDTDNDNLYDKHGSYVRLPMITGGIVFLFLFFPAFFYLDMIISGYTNPEYWALQTIMRQLSGCK